QRVRRDSREAPEARSESGVGHLDLAVSVEERELVVALVLVPVRQSLGEGAVVALDRRERRVRDAVLEQPWGGADQGVAALDVGVEEAQRLAGFEGFQPER